MFEINDMVVYGAQGVCRITGTEQRKIDGVCRQYFILKAEDDKGAIFYVPTWNEKALSKMRKIMTAEDINALIDSIPREAPEWLENENERKEKYKQVLGNGDQAAILTMVQAIYLHKKIREAQGRRLHMSDEYFMKDALLLLYNEWQYVLKMDRNELTSFITTRLQDTQ